MRTTRRSPSSVVAIVAALSMGLGAADLAAQQPAKPFRIGFLHPGTSPNSSADVFRSTLNELGYVEGRDVNIEFRWAEGHMDRLSPLAAELVALNVDVILGSGPWIMRSVRKATNTIPIVGIDLESDPVASGFVASLARPGGNVTGIFLDLPELSGKQLQFLKEIVPGLVRVAVLWEPEIGEPQLQATEEAARMVDIRLNALGIRRAEEIRPAVERAARGRAQALVVLTSPLLSNNLRQIVEMTQKYRLPTISPFISFADAGALMAYGPSQPEMYRRAASYVDKILRGAKAGELPVERPSKFELAINLKTAKGLGLTIPPSLLQRADELIQ